MDFGLSSGDLKTEREKTMDQYSKFSNRKWFKAHNILSEILECQIPQEVAVNQYGLGSDELRRGIKQFKRRHPNFPCGI